MRTRRVGAGRRKKERCGRRERPRRRACAVHGEKVEHGVERRKVEEPVRIEPVVEEEGGSGAGGGRMRAWEKKKER